MNSQKKLSIEDFHLEVPQEYGSFALQAHELLTQKGYKSKFQHRKFGIAVQYISPNTKGLALQFFIREHVLHMYLYNIFLAEYDGFLDNLPAVVIEEFAEYRNCIDSCSPVCTGPRLKFTINDTQYRKCVVGRRLFTVDEEIVGILSVLKKETS